MKQPNKGKPVTTSVPSISIKFHANAEQLEDFYGSDEEHPSSDATVETAVSSETESSPLKYLPRLVKRSTSIDITSAAALDASPPSDPWRFLSDIKGKITKSVEDKITEIKTRNQEEGSPLKHKTVKDSKDNSSLSDSEDLSESSISKTCGIVSTTEGAEMSSDDETPSIEKDKKTEDRTKPAAAIACSGGFRQRFRLLKPKSAHKEAIISKKGLIKLYNINADKIEQAVAEESDVESAVDALEDTNLQSVNRSDEKIVKGIEQQFDNIKIDKDNVLVVEEIDGAEMKPSSSTNKPKIVFAPVGFVDLRTVSASVKKSIFGPTSVLLVLSVAYFFIHWKSSYVAGFIVGVVVACTFYHIKQLLETPSKKSTPIPSAREIVEVPAVKEFQPLSKYEGWMNEYPDVYKPDTYHISQTQSVYVKLQGNLLRLSHTRAKVPKRALWHETKVKPAFTHHRVYNMLGAKVVLLPEGLAKKRHWSKKYPIAIILNKDQVDFDSSSVSPSVAKVGEEGEGNMMSKPARTFGFNTKKNYHVLAQRFSKLTEENEEFELYSEISRTSTPSPPSPAEPEDVRQGEDDSQEIQDEAFVDSLSNSHEKEALEDELATFQDWGTNTPPDESPSETKLYLFGRTDREKEDWFRRLRAAARESANGASSETNETAASDSLCSDTMTDTDYMRYMLSFNKDETSTCRVQWMNAFVGRVLFDCLRDDNFTKAVKHKIQSKMASIKLPYFMEGLLVTELSLGQKSPLINKASKTTLDERGLWIDLDITYEGLIVLILQTKLNLMKLKQPPSNDCNRDSERSAMFNSDVEDSAESTSDEDSMSIFPNSPASDASGVAPAPVVGGTTNTTGKKFMKMVDRIAESKFFQAATEYRYIKKAMEGVSNTDLRLKVEFKELAGTLVLNIPPPPSDRVWFGFRPTPDLELSAQPIVGERNITFLRITSWIEKKLLQEFQKLMVIPNMEDFIIPVMNPKLPQ